MQDLPDHPDIRSAELTGYGPGHEADDEINCPICGEELLFDDEVFVNEDDEIVGCSYCIRVRSAESVLE